MGKTVCICGGQITDDKCIRCKASKRATKERSARAMIKQRAYRSARWIEYSVAFRQRFPVCAHCERAGRVTAISSGDGIGQVDHIVPFSEPTDPLFWDELNHQGLCVECHGKKTWMETSGRYTAKMIKQDRDQRKKQIEAFDEEYG